MDEGNLEETDPNLDRYLRHGRRHTLGAAHHTIIAEDMRRCVCVYNGHVHITKGSVCLLLFNCQVFVTNFYLTAEYKYGIS